MPLIIILIVAAIVFLAFTFRIVPQSERWVIEKIGRYSCTWDAGIHVHIPFINRVARKVSTKELPMDIPPQPVITKDNVTIAVDSFVFYRITDAKLFTYGIDNFDQAMGTLTVSTLRNIIGNLDLEGCLTSRDEINKRITAELDQATDRWGVKVIRVEIKNITPPRDIQQAMDRQMKADREKREKIINAEGDRKARLEKAQADKEAQLLKAEADKESALMSAEAAKLHTIKAAEADKAAVLLAAEAQKESRVLAAQAEAEAIIALGKAQAEALRLLNEASPSDAVLRLKACEALIEASKGEANKVIIPSEIASAVSLVSSVKESLK